MRTKTELVKQAFNYAEQGDMQSMGKNMSDDFKFSGATPEPIDKNQFIELMKSLTTAIPDWKFNAADFREEGDTVYMKVYITGRNTGTLDLPSLGLKSIPATDRNIKLPAEPISVVVRSGKIVSMKVTAKPGGGVTGILYQLGIKVPAGVR